ncbi:MAG TPA: hypothetical protein VHR86_07965, partial [Armatimonadota bacterium]|nr:hypothetical protein [Armatimonadota bacterium]
MYIFVIIGGVLGKALSDWYLSIAVVHNLVVGTDVYRTGTTIALMFLGALAGWLISSIVSRQLVSLTDNLEELSTAEKLETVIGVTAGIGLATLFVLPLPVPNVIRLCMWPLASVTFAYLGARIFLSMKDDIYLIWPSGTATAKGETRETKESKKGSERIKILDTNVIIDGRIADIYRTGFIEGPLYVPGCVLEELHHISDSAEGLKRARGRRGLDILNQL